MTTNDQTIKTTEHIAAFVNTMLSLVANPHDGTPISPEQIKAACMGAQELMSAMQVLKYTNSRIGTDVSCRAQMDAGVDGYNNVDDLNRVSTVACQLSNLYFMLAPGNNVGSYGTPSPNDISQFFGAYNRLHAADIEKWRKVVR